MSHSNRENKTPCKKCRPGAINVSPILSLPSSTSFIYLYNANYKWIVFIVFKYIGCTSSSQDATISSSPDVTMLHLSPLTLPVTIQEQLSNLQSPPHTAHIGLCLLGLCSQRWSSSHSLEGIQHPYKGQSYSRQCDNSKTSIFRGYCLHGPLMNFPEAFGWPLLETGCWSGWIISKPTGPFLHPYGKRIIPTIA